MRYRVFCSDLQGFPEPVIAAACRRYRRSPSAKGFPFVGELLALCEDEMRALRPKRPAVVAVPPVYPDHPQPLKMLGYSPTETDETPGAEVIRGIWSELDQQRQATPEAERAYLERIRAIHGPRNELLAKDSRLQSAGVG